MSGLIIQYAFEYTDENRGRLKEYKGMQELAEHLKKQNLVDKFASYAENKGLKRRNLMIQRSHKLLERFIYSRIIYNMQN
jgi:carboxyl-terminal processing protease